MTVSVAEVANAAGVSVDQVFDRVGRGGWTVTDDTGTHPCSGDELGDPSICWLHGIDLASAVRLVNPHRRLKEMFASISDSLNAAAYRAPKAPYRDPRANTPEGYIDGSKLPREFGMF